MKTNSRIFIAGHRGLVGSAIYRTLQSAGYEKILVQPRSALDLRDKRAVSEFFTRERPEFVFLAAAKVGGIIANSTHPVAFLLENLQIQMNVIEAAFESGVTRLLFLGSSCIYPKLCPQPIREEYLLTGPLEPTNRPYAVAKIAGIELCWSYNREHGTSYLAAMPTNLYGLEDNFDLENSHVLPALMRKAVEAKAHGASAIEVWGSGTPRREFLYNDDLAEACIFLMHLNEERFASLVAPSAAPLINIGTGEDLTIRELAELICQVAGFTGEITFDPSRPDGTPRKVLDVSRIQSLGWRAKTPLEEGIRRVYRKLAEPLQVG